MTRRRVVLGACVTTAAVAAGLAVGLTRGGPTKLSWTPTEGRKPVRTAVLSPAHRYTFAQAVKAGVTPSLKEEEQESGLPLCGTKPPATGEAHAAYERTVKRNDGDTCMADPRGATFGVAGTTESFFALNSAPSDHNTSRYVDSDGWAIVFPRVFHGIAFSTVTGTAGGEDGATFANYTPVPDAAAPPVPPAGVLLAITTTWDHVAGRARLGHDSRFPLRLPAFFETHATGSMQRGDFDFQGDGVAYHASILAGPKASKSDLEALEQMVASISFPPTTAGGARPSGGRSPRAS